MVSMKIVGSGVEHALERYDDNNGYGLTFCGEMVGPWDQGPNQNDVECAKCKVAVGNPKLALGNSKLDWKKIDSYEEAIVGDFSGGDGVRFSLCFYATCYRRGQWRLLVEVASGPKHELGGCFDEQDQPQRWYHKRENAISEAQAIADVLISGRYEAK